MRIEIKHKRTWTTNLYKIPEVHTQEIAVIIESNHISEIIPYKKQIIIIMTNDNQYTIEDEDTIKIILNMEETTR